MDKENKENLKEIPYWLDSCEAINGKKAIPSDGGVLVIGSGFAGTSSALHLLLKGFDNVKIHDVGAENSSFYRNAGHILHGMGESYKAVSEIRGRDTAKQLFDLSDDFCEYTEHMLDEMEIDCEYLKGNYYVIPIDKAEEKELEESVQMMNEDEVGATSLGNIGGGFWSRHCHVSAQAHPTKFRNGVLEACLRMGVEHTSSEKVTGMKESDQGVHVFYEDGSESIHEAVISCANAYNPLFLDELKSKIAPFRGQIITSKPLDIELTRMAFSADHGYIYGQTTEDNRILIGGWRNHTEGESGDYELKSNPKITKGLQDFVNIQFNLEEEIEWEYCWTGIMGSSHNGLPLVGPVAGCTRVFTCSGFTGYGFGWAFGCGKLLADIIMGEEIPKIAYELRP